jgi:hypothetical protein
MSSLDQLFRDADALIKKRAAAVVTLAPQPDDEVTKLADLLAKDGEVKQAAPVAIEETLFEKVAHAIAIIETMEKLGEINKLVEFEKKAAEAGHTAEQIDAFIEKKGMKLSPKYLKILGGAAALGASGAVGAHAGKKKGYQSAVEDVNKALESYASASE